jgi:hypothetical protein
MRRTTNLVILSVSLFVLSTGQALAATPDRTPRPPVIQQTAPATPVPPMPAPTPTPTPPKAVSLVPAPSTAKPISQRPHK